MKNLTYLLLLPCLILLGACSENGDPLAEKEFKITISGESRLSPDCTRKCIRISSSRVQMDNCYDEETFEFTDDKEVNLVKQSFFEELLQTKADFWEKLENETDEHSSEDAGLPFIVTLNDNGVKKSFILLRIYNYPTKKYGDFMDKLKQVFDKWED